MEGARWDDSPDGDKSEMSRSEEPFHLTCSLVKKTEASIQVRTLQGERIWFPLSTVIEENFTHGQGFILIEPWIARKKGVW